MPFSLLKFEHLVYPRIIDHIFYLFLSITLFHHSIQFYIIFFLFSLSLLEFRKTTDHFNAKNWCSGRTYRYLIPAIAFAPISFAEVARLYPPELREAECLYSCIVSSFLFYPISVVLEYFSFHPSHSLSK